jgi:23S rRNA (cytosine1962-C5)-methyltransferase
MTPAAETALLDLLPALPEKRLAVRVTPDAFRQVRSGHPWVYAEAITSVRGGPVGDAPPGTLAVVFDADREFAAIGLWDPDSPIRLRVLHAGKPRAVDGAFWEDRIRSAHELRRHLVSEGTTGYRLVNGENDGASGLIIDIYGDVAVIKIYTPAWFPHLRAVIDALTTVLQPGSIVVRLGRIVERLPEAARYGLDDGCVIAGRDIEGPVLFTENGLTFEADVLHGQKTGHFLDQRENRQRVRAQSGGASVLDVFSCTGGFSVFAAAGGATLVHSVDQSPQAIAGAEANMAHNAALTSSTTHELTTDDAFRVMDRLGHAGEQFDIVVIDPPSFASRAAERDGAIRAYRKLAELGVRLVRPGGLLVQASCSSRVDEDDFVATVRAAIRAQDRSLDHYEVTGHAIDHPVTFPQGRYLKAVFATVGSEIERIRG